LLLQLAVRWLPVAPFVVPPPFLGCSGLSFFSSLKPQPRLSVLLERRGGFSLSPPIRRTCVPQPPYSELRGAFGLCNTRGVQKVSLRPQPPHVFLMELFDHSPLSPFSATEIPSPDPKGSGGTPLSFPDFPPASLTTCCLLERRQFQSPLDVELLSRPPGRNAAVFGFDADRRCGWTLTLRVILQV